MYLFDNPQEELKLRQALRALVQEWGADNVVVALPSRWKNKTEVQSNYVRFEFSTIDTIAILVKHETAHVRYEVKINV